MGEDVLRLISDYRTRLTVIRSTMASEFRIPHIAFMGRAGLV